MIVDEAAESFAQRRTAEIDQKPDRLLCQPEVGEKLFRVDGANAIDRFDFHQQSPFDQQVNSECRLEDQSIILDVDRLLPIHRIAKPLELGTEDAFINRFHQTRPKLAVELDRHAENLTANLVDILQNNPSASPRLCANQTY